MGCCQDLDYSLAEYDIVEVKEVEIKPRKNKRVRSTFEKITDIIVPIMRNFFVHSTNGIIDETYEIREILGQGGFSTVYRAVHRESSLERAIKIVAKNSINESQKNTLIDEIDSLKMLDHPNIIRIIEVVEDRSKINIVTELCSGGELFDKIIASGTLSENTAAAMMYQILSGLIHIHSSGLMHRDLKPENILFLNDSDDFVLKIIDFGVSKKVSEKSKLTRVIGTVGYK